MNRSCAVNLLLLLLFLAAGGLLAPRIAHADITCTASMPDLNFGTVNPLFGATYATTTLNYTCSNSSRSTHSATVCFSLGNYDHHHGHHNYDEQREMSAGRGDDLEYQLYQNPAHSIIWGSTSGPGSAQPLMVNMTIPAHGSISGSATLYGEIPGGQRTASPGSYTDPYGGDDASFTINDEDGKDPPGRCSNRHDTSFGFQVVSAVIGQCQITASNLDFGNVNGFLNSNVDGESTISVQCINRTHYRIGLNNGQHANGSVRRMQGSGGYISYELYQNAGRTVRWGNTPGTDTVNGRGTGNTQNFAVYGRVPPQTTPSAGNYSDTVTVTVTY